MGILRHREEVPVLVKWDILGVAEPGEKGEAHEARGTGERVAAPSPAVDCPQDGRSPGGQVLGALRGPRGGRRPLPR